MVELVQQTQSLSNSLEASALLLNNPIALSADRVISHPEPTVNFNTKKATPSSTSAKKQNFLSLQKIQKMIDRFITEKQMSTQQLAKMLGVAPHKLEQLDATNYDAVVAEINLPLIKLYCKTKWF